MTTSREEIESIFDKFSNRRVLVTGDVMLDAYWWGKVERISPEAPVPIVNVSRREYRLGGAANVALNLKKLGAVPIVCSVIGRDMEGEVFLRMLEEAGISAEGIIISDTRPTTVKTRVIGNKNQLLRIDNEDDKLINAQEGKELKERALELLQGAELLLFEDYDKGVIGERLLEETIAAANKAAKPIVVDPKKRNFLNYHQATLFKPNLREMAEGLKLDIDGKSPIEEIEVAARELKDKLDLRVVMVTLSERGVYVLDENGGTLLPAHIRRIYDVSGAGDTVVSVAALALLAGADAIMLASLANLAGGLVCEKVGVVPIEKDELLKQALKDLL